MGAAADGAGDACCRPWYAVRIVRPHRTWGVVVSLTLCASHVATGIRPESRSGRAVLLCDELVPDDVDTCPACGSESPDTRATYALERLAHSASAKRGDVEKTVQRMTSAAITARTRPRP